MGVRAFVGVASFMLQATSVDVGFKVFFFSSALF